MSAKTPATHTIGRRKTATARAYLKPGKGEIIINGLSCDDYFGRETLRMVVRQPLVATSQLESFDVKVNVKGGGKSGQAGAVRHAIARALVKVDGETRTTIKPLGFLTRDPREVERKKFGRHKARKRPQFSKR